MSINGRIRFIDLFAGIGGMRLALEQAANDNNLNADCVFTSEIDKHANETYRANFGNKELHGDITEIENEKIPHHDILLAGFPCQAFSQAGLKRGFEDSRGTMFFEILRILKAKKPKAFLLENVKNLKNHDGGRTFAGMTNSLLDLGYEVHSGALNARNFGLPQNRERLMIVGFRENGTYFQFPENKKIPTVLGDILEADVSEKYTLSNQLWQGHQRRKQKHIEQGKGFGYRLFNHCSNYTGTLSARYYKDGSEILIEQKNRNPRKLTPRECARLQGFSDGFIIPVSDTQAYKQFGNSVPVPLIKAVCSRIVQTSFTNDLPISAPANDNKLKQLQMHFSRAA